MALHRIFRTPLFIEQFQSYDDYHQHRVMGFIHQLTWKGGQVGKPLGNIFFREKKFNGNRMYFLVYVEWHSVLLVMFSDKKKQTQTIEKIKSELPIYRNFVYEQLKKEGLI